MDKKEEGQELPIAQLYMEAVKLASTVEEGVAEPKDVLKCIHLYETLVERLSMYGSVVQAITTLLQNNQTAEATLLAGDVMPQFNDEFDFCRRINNMFAQKLLTEQGIDPKDPEQVKGFVEQSMGMFNKTIIDDEDCNT